MKFHAATVSYLLLASSGPVSVSAFSVPTSRHQQYRRRTFNRRSSSSSNSGSSMRAGPDLEEFDYLLQEGTTTETNTVPTSRRRIALTTTGDDTRSTILASTFAGPSTAITAEEAVMSEEEAAAAAEADPYADVFDPQMGKIQQYEEQTQSPSNTLAAKFKQMDLQDIIMTLFIPSVVLFAAGRWGYNRVAGRVQEKAETLLDGFAREMIFHDGDFKEMELCVSDYKRRLVWMGPSMKDAMLKRYLESYAKKKTISPQAIASLSYVFTIFKLSEQKAANLLVSLCKQMGTDKISSAGKLLFLGSRILKSPEGAEALTPIKDLIKSTYRDAEVAEMLVETSQHAIAEASYRATVQASGKNQKKLTIGWEVLGLDRDTAVRIFEEEAKEGFVSDREAMYGGQTQKYDKSGNRLDKDGSLENPADAEKAGDDDDEPVSNVYECSECGYTLFIADGRESKFFGEGFRCPDCGAPKDKFKARDDIDD